MTPGLDISINLSSGEAVRRSQRPAGASDAGQWVEQRRMLTPAELSELRAVVKNGLVTGLETKQCLDKEQRLKRNHEIAPPPPPMIDSISQLFVMFGGKELHSPTNWLCENHAYKLLWTEAVNLASGTHFSVPADINDR